MERDSVVAVALDGVTGRDAHMSIEPTLASFVAGEKIYMNPKLTIKDECLSAHGVQDIPELSVESLEDALDWSVDRVKMQDSIAKDAEKDKIAARKLFDELVTEAARRAGQPDPQNTKMKWGEIQRIVVERGASFEWARFQDEHPELFDQVVEVEITMKRTLREDAVGELVEAHPELLPVFQEYAIPGTISTQIRPAAADETDD